MHIPTAQPHPLRFQIHAHVQLHVLCDRLVQLHPVLLERRQPVLGDWDLRGGMSSAHHIADEAVACTVRALPSTSGSYHALLMQES